LQTSLHRPTVFKAIKILRLYFFKSRFSEHYSSWRRPRSTCEQGN